MVPGLSLCGMMSAAELFFDLVFVFTLTQLTALLFMIVLVLAESDQVLPGKFA
jgi:low temperature requirement protein LtrA